MSVSGNAIKLENSNDGSESDEEEFVF